MHPLLRAIAAALVGAVAGPACLLLLHTWSPVVALGTERDLPPIATGFYPLERVGRQAWFWTAGRAEVTFAGLDRRGPWSCSVRFRGARGDPAAQPELEIAVDGIRAAVRRGTDEYQELEVVAPSSPQRSGLVLTLTSSTTFVPGGSDARTLGVQIERVACRPVEAGLLLPPRPALRATAVASAALGGAFGLAATTLAAAAGGSVVFAAALAAALTSGSALVTSFPSTIGRLGAWTALAMILALAALRAGARRPLSSAARFVVAFLAAALCLKLAALLHPSKPLVDALFHAHRFEWVLNGRFYFTQLSTSATPFPYAIGLYLVAAPWSILTRDYVSLLRIIVVAADVLACGLLYVAIVRTWGDRLAGAVAVLLGSLVPLWYLLIGSANLTNAFGQSVSTATVVAAVLWAERPGRVARLLGLTLLATLGLLCHVSTVALLLTTLLGLAALYRWRGGPSLGGAARCVALAAVIAAALSTLLYWGHFGSVYAARLEGMRTAVTARLSASGAPPPDAAPPPQPAAGAAATGTPAIGRAYVPIHRRITGALRQTVANLGWPLIILAAVGVWRLRAEGANDRLTLAAAAWGLVCLLFVALSVVTAVDRTYQQDAWEFIGRVELLTYPAALVVAGRGAAWAWRRGAAFTTVSGALLAAAAAVGAAAWRAWMP